MAPEYIAKVASEFERLHKPVVACFDAQHGSFARGAILLKGIDTQLGLPGLAALDCVVLQFLEMPVATFKDPRVVVNLE